MKYIMVKSPDELKQAVSKAAKDRSVTITELVYIGLQLAAPELQEVVREYR